MLQFIVDSLRADVRIGSDAFCVRLLLSTKGDVKDVQLYHGIGVRDLHTGHVTESRVGHLMSCSFTSSSLNTNAPYGLQGSPYGRQGRNVPGFICCFWHCINCLVVYLPFFLTFLLSFSVCLLPYLFASLLVYFLTLDISTGAVMLCDSYVDFGAI